MLRSDLFNHSDAYIIVKRIITVEGIIANDQTNKKFSY